MDTDFPESPPKRRRTMSPDEGVTSEQPLLATGEDGGFLDVLMQQVEAQTQASTKQQDGTSLTKEEGLQSVDAKQTQPPQQDPHVLDVAGQDVDAQARPDMIVSQEAELDTKANPTEDKTVTDPAETQDGTNGKAASEQDKTETTQHAPPQKSSNDMPMADSDATQEGQTAQPSSETNDVPTVETDRPPSITNTLAPGASEPTTTQEREWATDSSPIDSSPDSDSSDLSSSDEDSDDEADGDYDMLNPEEQMRILMQEEGGSDDEGNKAKHTANLHMRTANEKTEEVIPKPDIEVTPEMALEQLGAVEAIVENTVVIKATISGEYQVLESGSLVCLQDRSVVGVVSETLGRVEQPMYTIRFTNNDAIKEAGLSEIGTIVHYVVPHSTFVFTQPLKGLKGSDASNFHDEEVGDDEMEFSDDEKEAEHKRLLKMKRKGIRDDGGRGGRVGRGGNRGGNRSANGNAPPYHNNGTGAATLNYDEEGETDYTPLTRPSNLHDMMGQTSPTEDANGAHFFPPPPPPSHSHHRGSGRGRGGERGSFRGRGRGRGGFNNDRRDSRDRQNSYPPANGYNQGYGQQQQSMPPPQVAYQQHQAYQQPHAPYLPAQQSPFSPFSPSPITPLPPGHFNFNQQQGYPPYPPMPPQPGQNSFGYPPQPNYQQQYAQGSPTNWHNAQAVNQVQRQLEEMRRGQGHGPGQ